LSGDLGYTYELFTVTAKDTTMQGTYVSIWKKQKDGNWKFVLDTGNPGGGKK
jgi:ketosteroid isomerase-like protein